MPDTNSIAITLVYFLIVYMIAIRKLDQSLPAWLLVIVAQAVSVFFYKDVLQFVKAHPFFSGLSDTICMIITIAGLVLVNFLFILLVNLILLKRGGKGEKKAKAERDAFNDLDNITISDLRPAAQPDEHTIQTENKPDSFAAAPGEEFKMPESKMEVDEKLFDSIQELIETGQTEDAVKSLRMVAFFGKDKKDIDKAKKMLMDLQIKNGGEVS